MRKKLSLRPLTEEERETLEKLIKSQIAPAIQVERARTIWLLHQGELIPAIGKKQERTLATIYRRLRRFNQLGLKSLADENRSGRPVTYPEAERSQMIAAVRTHPEQAGRPYSHWTLTRLTEYVHQELGIAISRAQLARVLEAEGLRWYQEQTYFTERPDPQFGEKGGHSPAVAVTTFQHARALHRRVRALERENLFRQPVGTRRAATESKPGLRPSSEYLDFWSL